MYHSIDAMGVPRLIIAVVTVSVEIFKPYLTVVEGGVEGVGNYILSVMISILGKSWLVKQATLTVCCRKEQSRSYGILYTTCYPQCIRRNHRTITFVGYEVISISTQVVEVAGNTIAISSLIINCKVTRYLYHTAQLCSPSHGYFVFLGNEVAIRQHTHDI